MSYCQKCGAAMSGPSCKRCRPSLWPAIRWLIVCVVLAVVFTWLAVSSSRAQSTTPLVTCNSVKIYDASTNGSTQLITAPVPTLGSIQVCGFTIWAAGTATVKFVYGTGTACATGETVMTPAYSLVTQTGVNDTSVGYRGMNAPPGNNVCIKTSAGVAVQAAIYYIVR